MSYDKIVDSSALDASLTAVADAIRKKTGKTATMTLAEMPTEIEGISGGGDTSIEDSLVTRTVTEYTNNRITSIPAYAFEYCYSLTAVSFSDVTSIGKYAFRACTAMTSINFPNVRKLGSDAFYLCDALTSVDFTRAETLSDYAFERCTKLQSLDFSALTSIASYAFCYCYALTALILRNTTKVCSLGSTTAFNNTPIQSGTGYIYVPDALVDSYKAATNWSTYAAQIKPLSEYTGG